MSYSTGYCFTSGPNPNCATHEPDSMFPSFKSYLEGKLEAGTLFFEIFGPEGRQAFSRPPAFAHALAEAKGGGQPAFAHALGGLAKLGLPALSLDVLCLGCVAAVRSVGWSVWGLFGRCLTKQVGRGWPMSYSSGYCFTSGNCMVHCVPMP